MLFRNSRIKQFSGNVSDDFSTTVTYFRYYDKKRLEKLTVVANKNASLVTFINCTYRYW